MKRNFLGLFDLFRILKGQPQGSQGSNSQRADGMGTKAWIVDQLLGGQPAVDRLAPVFNLERHVCGYIQGGSGIMDRLGREYEEMGADGGLGFTTSSPRTWNLRRVKITPASRLESLEFQVHITRAGGVAELFPLSTTVTDVFFHKSGPHPGTQPQSTNKAPRLLSNPKPLVCQNLIRHPIFGL